MKYLRHPALFLVCALFALAANGLLIAAKQKPLPPEPPPFLSAVADEWLQGPDRSDFPWQVNLLPPMLTLQQRHLVEVTAWIPMRGLRKNKITGEIYVFIRVQDSQGHGLGEHRAVGIEMPTRYADEERIVFNAGIYMGQGNYVVAVMAYEQASGKGNLRRVKLRVPRLENDPLPEMDALFPPVEFAKDISRPPGLPLGDLWGLANQSGPLVIANKVPARIDLVLILPQNQLPERVFGGASRNAISTPSGMDEGAISRIQSISYAQLLQAAQVLSSLDLTAGCLRVSMIDIRRLQVLFYRQAPSMLDWDQLQERDQRETRHTVEVSELQNLPQQSAFLLEFLARILADTEICSTGRDSSRHVIAIVATQVRFPDRTKPKQLDSKSCANCSFYYFQLNSDFRDDIADMLRPVRARWIGVDSGLSFRKGLARLKSDIEMAAAR